MRRPLLSAIAGDPEIKALLSDEEQIHAILAFENALGQAEAEAGLISHASATAIASSIGNFRPDWDDLAAGMARDGVVVPSLIAQLRATLPADCKSDLHRGATSQDAIDTALCLQLARILPILLARVVDIEAQLATLVDRFGQTTLTAHTRMQAALPFTVQDKLRTWSEPLARHQARLHDMVHEVAAIQLGGPIGDRSTFGGKGEIVARAMARNLGLAFRESWHSAREPVVALGGQLAMLSGSLGKIGIDVALMAQTEVGEIKLRTGGRSSAMPHKSNPVDAEVLVALARHTAGLSGSLGQAMIHEGERSGSAWMLEWLILPQLIVATGAGLLTAQRLLRQLTF